jgi:hypothetical protein
MRSASSGRAVAMLALVGFLVLLISAPSGRSPNATAMQSASPTTIEDWRGNSARIRPYGD